MSIEDFGPLVAHIGHPEVEHILRSALRPSLAGSFEPTLHHGTVSGFDSPRSDKQPVFDVLLVFHSVVVLQQVVDQVLLFFPGFRTGERECLNRLHNLLQTAIQQALCLLVQPPSTLEGIGLSQLCKPCQMFLDMTEV